MCIKLLPIISCKQCYYVSDRTSRFDEKINNRSISYYRCSLHPNIEIYDHHEIHPNCTLKDSDDASWKSL
jgi:hypothetical protein